jgi:aspartyl-tRNA(Asn)/glutamyl-tRNA(Gln) amidotransferase subunit A
MDLTSLTITEAAGLLARREISPVELTQAHLRRIERLEPALNCFITLTPEAAGERAGRAEMQRGEYRGTLQDPLTLKDHETYTAHRRLKFSPRIS